MLVKLMQEARLLEIISLFHLDSLGLIMGALILFVSLCVGSFSWHYLKGDATQSRFYSTLVLLVISVLILVSADHLLLFLLAWAMGNLLLTRLMVHKSSWKAAKESGRLALKNFAKGFIALSAAAALLYVKTGETSIQAIISNEYQKTFLAFTLSLIFIAAMAQSALWPFHRWLTSSLNSPTPVSAVMHAGLINGGGFLLARFAPLYAELPEFLIVIFVLGFVTAFLGIAWKLMQNDVKRMLACSTMGQMGFMVVQCGLGLFPAAIAHLVWHGLFKAYLFLASGSAAQEKRLDLGYPPRVSTFILSTLCGVIGTCAFAISSQTNLMAFDTSLFLVGMSFIAASQMALTILQLAPIKRLPLAVISVALTGLLYGFSVYQFDQLLPNILKPQPLNSIHVIGFILLFTAWLGILFGRNPNKSSSMPEWALRLYVWMLNASQPHPKTITTHRNDYQYQ
jgi:NAD(P)H-quinone oxidoreductase subunit 5